MCTWNLATTLQLDLVPLDVVAPMPSDGEDPWALQINLDSPHAYLASVLLPHSLLHDGISMLNIHQSGPANSVNLVWDC